MKDKLNEHFKDQLFITEINGKSNVVTFRHRAATILSEFYKERNLEESQSDKCMRIVQTAAKLIRSEIKKMDSSSSDKYPSHDQLMEQNLALGYLPPTLQEMLGILFTGKDTDLKRASIGQAIMQGTRPRVILAPLQFGLAEQMHHKFVSRFLVDTLHKHGFGCSYSEIQQFERNAAAQGVNI